MLYIYTCDFQVNFKPKLNIKENLKSTKEYILILIKENKNNKHVY